MKKCYKCKIEKELNEFHKNKSRKDGLSNQCKCCVKEYQKKYIDENKHKIIERDKIYYENNKEAILIKKKKYRDENKHEISEWGKIYYEENKEVICTRNKKYRTLNKEKITKCQRNWEKNNPHIISWRAVLKSSLKRMGLVKTENTIDMLGYNPEDLKPHLESLFIDGMTWDNHGEWHIDHKIPLTAFKKDTPMHVVNALENLQPLWATDNLSKSNKILEEYKDMEIYINYCI